MANSFSVSGKVLLFYDFVHAIILLLVIKTVVALIIMADSCLILLCEEIVSGLGRNVRLLKL
jgi:hypothetical protein